MSNPVTGSPRVGRNDWASEYQYDCLVAGGFTTELAKVITNLLDLHSMEAYKGADGQCNTVWRVQYQRHAFQRKYCTVPGDDTDIQNWIDTCREVEARY